MQKLIFQPHNFENIRNENFEGVLSRHFTDSLFDKPRNRILLFGGTQIQNWDPDLPLFSVFGSNLHSSFGSVQDSVYFHRNPRFLKKSSKKPVYFSELMDSETLGWAILKSIEWV